MIFKLNITISLQNTDLQNKMSLYHCIADKQALSAEFVCLNKMSCLSQEKLERGVVCASAGNHDQGLAYACNKLRIK